MSSSIDTITIFMNSRLDAKGINKAIIKMRALKAELQATGTPVKDINFAISDLGTGMGKMGKKVEQTGGILESFIRGPLNKLGFAIFITQSTIQTITGLFTGMFNVLEEGAAISDRAAGFMRILSGEGLNPRALKRKLEEAGQGIVKIDTAFSKTIQLLKAGFPEIAAQSDALLRIATNSAILSGEVDKADEIFQKLIRGIIRGSPRLIDDADIILKLGNANEEYAESLGKAVTELTAAEKVQATFNAVIQEGETINALAEDVSSLAVVYGDLSTRIQEAIDRQKEFLGLKAIQLFGGSNEVRIINKELGTLVDRLDVLNEIDILKITGDAEGAQALQNLFDFIEGEIGRGPNKIESLAVGESAESFKRVELEYRQHFNRMLEIYNANIGMLRLRIPPPELGLPGPDELLFTNLVENLFGNIDDILDAIKAADRLDDHNDALLDAQDTFKEKFKEIGIELAEELIDIEDNKNSTLLRLEEDYEIARLRIQQNFDDRIADINEDLADKLSDISEDADIRRLDAREKSAKKLEDLEKDHQKRINEILRRFDISRMKAVIDRDARALFEAEQKRDEDLRKQNEANDEGIQDEKDGLADLLKEIAKAEERRRRDAIKAAERRRRDAQKAADRRRRDEQKRYDRRRKDELADAEKRRKEAIDDANKREANEMESFDRKIINLSESFAEQEAEIERSVAVQLLIEAGRHDDSLDQLRTYMRDVIEEWEELSDILNDIMSDLPLPEIPTVPGDGSDPDSPNDPGTPDSPTPDQIRPGMPCSVSGNRSYIGFDGRSYLCWNGVWTFVGNVPGGITASFSGGITGGVDVGSGKGFSGGQAVRIVVQGDKTLEQIFKEISYEAFIDVVGN